MYLIIGGDGKEYGPISGADLRKWIAEGRLSAGMPAPLGVYVSGLLSRVDSVSSGNRVALPTCLAATKSSETVLRKPPAVGCFAVVRKQASEAWSPPISGCEIPEKTVN